MNKNILTIILLVVTSTLTFAQKNFIDQAYIEITAKSDTLVVPDKIYISIILNEADSKNKKTLEEQERLLELTLKNLDIDIEKHLSLSDLLSNFKNYFLKGQNIIKAKQYILEVGNAVTAGKVLSELESVGISNIGINSTEYSKREELLVELKSQAILKSKLEAEKLASAIGQKVGKALHISFANDISNTWQGASGITVKGMSSLYGSRKPETIQTEFQKLKFEVQVYVKYILE